MPTFFGKMRKQLAAENRFMKYSRYAVGEIVLVVIGILIALQINNANQERKDNNALEGYLNSIGLNIQSDLSKADFILNKRKEIHERAELIDNDIRWRVRTNQNYDVNDINYVSEAMKEVINLNYLNPNLSGFESLKNSGFLSKLQGSDLEQLLNNYYNLVNEIVLDETNYNQLIQNAFERYNESNYIGSTYFYNPDFNQNWDAAYYQVYREQFNEILISPSFRSMLEIPVSLIAKYQNVAIYGEALVHMIQNRIVRYDDIVLNKLEDVFDVHGTIGYPVLIEDGAINGYFDFAGDTSVAGDWLFSNFKIDEIEIDYPDYAWGALFLYNGSGLIEQLRTKDYSSYKTLNLELKGDKGGETVFIALKDVSNPKDGSEKKVKLTLTDEWAIYKIPLSEFEPTDLKELIMPVAFIFEKNPRKIYVKNVLYEK